METSEFLLIDFESKRSVSLSLNKHKDRQTTRSINKQITMDQSRRFSPDIYLIDRMSDFLLFSSLLCSMLGPMMAKKTFIVTGAYGGIGKAICELLADDLNHRVILAGRDEQQLNDAVTSLKSKTKNEAIQGYPVEQPKKVRERRCISLSLIK
jgi:FlaA1/EpsC-like NDP-sugar epimerase